MTNPHPASHTARRDVAQRMTDAAHTFLASLDDDQHAIAGRQFHDLDDREQWFYTPTDHGGLPLGSMAPAQQRHAHRLLASGLSRAGYVTVASIIGLENVVDELENFTVTMERERGRDPGLYYLRIFGQPSMSEPWAWRFGGHHVSINHTIVSGEVFASTPNFLGAYPATSPLLGPHLLRPLGAAEDLGRQLARSLTSSQLAAALLSPVAPLDLAGGNRPHFGLGDGDLPRGLADAFRQPVTAAWRDQMAQNQRAMEQAVALTPAHLEMVRLTAIACGISAQLMTSDQREILRALLDVYVGRVPDELADEERAKYATDTGLDDLTFAWAGALEPGFGHYYRVQGSRLLAEYDNSQNNANHVHSVWRDPRRDFGVDALGAHYATTVGSDHHHH